MPGRYYGFFQGPVGVMRDTNPPQRVGEITGQAAGSCQRRRIGIMSWR
jgi:hypothetical protein